MSQGTASAARGGSGFSVEEGMGWEEAEPENWLGRGDPHLLETPAHPRRRHPAACRESITGSAAGQ